MAFVAMRSAKCEWKEREGKQSEKPSFKKTRKKRTVNDDLHVVELFEISDNSENKKDDTSKSVFKCVYISPVNTM